MRIVNLVKQFTKEIAAYAQSGFSNVSAEDYQQRLEACNSCPNLKEGGIADTCKLCGCVVKMKAKLATSTCPDDPPRWNPQDPELIKQIEEKRQKDFKKRQQETAKFIKESGRKNMTPKERPSYGEEINKKIQENIDKINELNRKRSEELKKK